VVIVAFLYSSFFAGTLSISSVKADEDYISYIVVELLSVKILDDKDPLGPGEVELSSVVVTETSKEQTFSWPIKKQDSSWHETNDGDILYVNATIFALREDQMGDYMAVVISAVDNDEIPGWVSKFTAALLKAGAEVAKAMKEPRVATAVKIIDAFDSMFFQWLSEAEKIGTYARIFTRLEWDVDVFQVAEEKDSMIVNYEIKRIRVPARTPPLSVRLLSVKGIGDEGWGDDGTSQPFIHTRVRDSTVLPPELIQTYTFGPVDKDENEYWIVDEEIFRTDAVGPFLHIEIDVWNEDSPWMWDDHDMLGIYSHTFWPDENWGIGSIVVAQKRGIGEGNVEIRFATVELPFSSGRISVEPVWEYEIEPGESTTYRVRVINTGNTAENYRLSVEGLDPTWYNWGILFPIRDLKEIELLLPAKFEAAFLLWVNPPRHWSITPGDYNFTVTATSLSDPSDSDSAEAPLRLLPFHDVEVFVVLENFTTEPGGTATYTIAVENLGNVRDTYDVTIDYIENRGGDSIQPSWTTLWPMVFLDLDPGEKGIGRLAISVPDDLIHNISFNFTVKALCQADPTVWAESNGTLIVALRDKIYVTLDIEVDVGSVHFRGEIAEFYISVSRMGEPVDADIRATLYYSDGAINTDLSSSVEHITRGLYRLPYSIRSDDPTGTWVLVVDASQGPHRRGTAIKSFLVSPTLTEWHENAMSKLISIEGNVGTILTEIGYVRMNLTDINAKITSIDGSIATIESDIGTIKTDISEIKTTLAGWTGTTTEVTTTEGTFNIFAITNSTLEKTIFSDNILIFIVNGPSGTEGIIHVVIPKTLLSSIESTIDQVVATVNEEQISFTYTEQAESYTLTITYTHSTEVIKIFLKGLPPTFPLHYLAIVVVASIATIGGAIYAIKIRKKP
jgi:hypothetical protein